jgi:Flp pilus assembly protein TadG
MYLDRCNLQDFQEAPDPKVPPKRNRRVGAALVEFAIVAPIMFLFFLGIYELGRTFMVVELMTEAAASADVLRRHGLSSSPSF